MKAIPIKKSVAGNTAGGLYTRMTSNGSESDVIRCFNVGFHVVFLPSGCLVASLNLLVGEDPESSFEVRLIN